MHITQKLHRRPGSGLRRRHELEQCFRVVRGYESIRQRGPEFDRVRRLRHEARLIDAQALFLDTPLAA